MGTTMMPGPDDSASADGVARDMADVARELEAESTPHETWQRICELAVKQIVGCEAAGISMVYSHGRIDTPVGTADVVQRVDQIQYETGQGPCLDAIREHDVFRTGDLAREDRWPDFAQRAAAETGVRSMLSFQLFVQDDVLGGLNLYSGQVDAFTDRDQSVGSLFVAHAALAMSNAQEHEHNVQLEAALESSRTIGVALGVLMAQQDVDRNTAFQILSSASQRSNVKLRDLAEQIVSGHEANRTLRRPGL